MKMRLKQFIERQSYYERLLKQLYADILQHLSTESVNLLTKDAEKFAECDKKRDPLDLWNVLQT